MYSVVFVSESGAPEWYFRVEKLYVPFEEIGSCSSSVILMLTLP
jgi:hypothetical protein